MKKKIVLLSATLLASTVSLSAVIFLSGNAGNISFATDKPSSLSCEYYFNEANGYKSIYELNDSRLNGTDISNVTTWGTVTCTYTDNSGNYSQFIQSTDKNGDYAGTCLYSIDENDVFPVGSVVTVKGLMTLYNGMSEMKNCTVTKDYDSNPSPVVAKELTKLPERTDSDFTDYRLMGTIKVNISEVSFGAIASSRESIMTLPNGNTMKAFFNNISNRQSIINKINEVRNNNQKADVTGYLTTFSNNNTGNPSLQILLRDPDDIVPVASTKQVESISASANKTFIYNDTISNSDFDVYAYYNDGSSSKIFDFNIVNYSDIDTHQIGLSEVQFSYTHNGKTVYTSLSINIVDSIYSIFVSNPIEVYAPNELFVEPKVYGESASDTIDISNNVTFTGFNSTYIKDDEITVSYVNSVGRTITTEYDYHVSNVHSFWLNGPKLEFTVGESYDYPTVYATFDYSPHNDIDVSSRTVTTGFDSSSAGLCDVTIRLGSYSYTYTVAIVDDVFVEELVLDNVVYSYDVGDNFIKPTVYAHYSNDTYEDVTNYCVFAGFSSLFAGKITITVTYDDVSTSYSVTINDYDLEHIYISEYFISWPSKYYDTGNYFSVDYNYEVYRGVKSDGDAMKLLPLDSLYEESLGGAFYNISPIKDIKSISLEYKVNMEGEGDLPKIYYGENHYDDNYVTLDYSSSYTAYTLSLSSSEEANYFRIDSGDCTLTINSIDIYYTDRTTEHGYSFVEYDANEGYSRIAPVRYTGTTFVDGETYVDFPTAIDPTTHSVTSTKRYYYYSYEYIELHPYLKDEAAMTNPTDVCNYYLAFGCAPANYGKSGTVNPLKDGLDLPSKSQVDSLFGSDARLIQQYSRTSGYATKLPYYGSTVLYYEFDIDMDGTYTTRNRQVGRIVGWASGFIGSDYGNGTQPICLYTDDHYGTFKEYNNYGGYMPRFSVDTNIAGAKWSSPITY